MATEAEPAGASEDRLPAPVRRTATILFTDIARLLRIAEQLSEEDLWRFLTEHYGIVGDAILERGGTIDKFMGDATLALFNLPEPLPDHEQQALHAGLAARQAYLALCERWGLDGEDNQLQVGIGTGEVLAGMLGHPNQHSYSVLGQTVNRAAQLCSRRHGGFALDATTYDAVRDLVVVEERQAKWGDPIYVVRDLRW